MLYNDEYLWKFIVHKGAVFLKKIQNILQQFYSYFKEIIATESNHLNSRVWTLQAAQSMKEGSMAVKPVINQCTGEELLRNYHNT